MNKQFTMIEEGVDVRWTEFGQLQIQTNDPNGYTTQRFTLRPATALKLCAWLEDRDTDEIRRRALAVDAQAFNPEADAAFRARRDSTVQNQSGGGEINVSNCARSAQPTVVRYSARGISDLSSRVAD